VLVDPFEVPAALSQQGYMGQAIASVMVVRVRRVGSQVNRRSCSSA
jgi:hypothetical protein